MAHLPFMLSNVTKNRANFKKKLKFFKKVPIYEHVYTIVSTIKEGEANGKRKFQSGRLFQCV